MLRVCTNSGAVSNISELARHIWSPIPQEIADGIFDCVGIGGSLLAELLQKFVSRPQDFNRAEHSSGPATGTTNEWHALLGAGLQGSYRGGRTMSVLGQVRSLAAILSARGRWSQIRASFAHGEF